MKSLCTVFSNLRIARSLLALGITAGLFSRVGGCVYHEYDHAHPAGWHDHDWDHNHHDWDHDHDHDHYD